MAQQSAATSARGVEPNALPHEIHCACCPRHITLSTLTYTPATDPTLRGRTEEYLPQGGSSGANQYEFNCGMKLQIREDGEYAILREYVLFEQLSPHKRLCHRMPHFGLGPGMVIWVCPSCEEKFKGHAFNVEQYLAERQRMFNKLESLRFKLSSSSDA